MVLICVSASTCCGLSFNPGRLPAAMQLLNLDLGALYQVRAPYVFHVTTAADHSA